MSRKISFFIGSLHGGGAERVISILANHFRRKGWNVDIVLLLDTEVGYVLETGINIIDLSQGTGSYYKHLTKWLRGIRKYVKEAHPDRIVSFVGRINLLVLTACIGINIPIIASERNDPKHDGRSYMMLKLCNWSYKKAKYIVFQTSYEQSCFSQKLNNAIVIGNPISINCIPKKVERPFEIVSAGRLHPQKNQKMLIDAVALIKEPHISLKIYGDGYLKNDLQTRINNYGLEDRVVLCGNVSDLHERINGAGLFVLCSEFEGLSNALIEAMSLGLVCISTDYPGANELIVNGVNGLIVPRNDSNKLAQAIELVLSDIKLRNKLSLEAIKTSYKYKDVNILNQWEEIIEG